MPRLIWLVRAAALVLLVLNLPMELNHPTRRIHELCECECDEGDGGQVCVSALNWVFEKRVYHIAFAFCELCDIITQCTRSRTRIRTPLCQHTREYNMHFPIHFSQPDFIIY